MSNKCELSGTKVLFGNMVSHSARKTRRRFLPNLKVVKFESSLMGCSYTFKVNVRCVRSIEKLGGLDDYILAAPNKFLSKKVIAIKKILKAKLNLEEGSEA